MTIVYGIKISSVLDLITLGKVVTMNELDKPNITRIAKYLGVHRDTVRKYYNGYSPTEKRLRESVVSDYHELIKSLLLDENKTFDYVSHLYRYMKRHHNIRCAENTFRRYVMNNFKKEFKKSKSRNSIRFETAPGEQAQFDYKENQTYIDINGNKMTTNIATLQFGYSRYIFREVIADKTTESLIRFLAQTFDKINGCPKQILFDNGASIATIARTKSNPGEINYKLKQFLDDYHIEGYLCLAGSPETKGKVEVQMKIVDELKCYGGEIKDYVHLNDILQNITEEQNYRISQATDFPPTLLWIKEKEHMNPLPRKLICSSYFIKNKEVMVNKQSLISFRTNKYSVPPEYIGLKVSVRVIGQKLHIYYNQKFLCTHEITNKKINYIKIHRDNLIYMTYKNHSNIVHNLGQLDENIRNLERIEYE